MAVLFYLLIDNEWGLQFSTSSLFLVIIWLLIPALLLDVKNYVIVLLICISLLSNDGDHPLTSLLAICITSLEKCLSTPLPIFNWITFPFIIDLQESFTQLTLEQHKFEQCRSNYIWILFHLRNLYADQEATVRTGHGTTDWFQIGKGVCHVCILSPWLFNLYAEYIMRNAGLEEAQAGIKIARRNISNLRYADGTTLMAESEEELKSLWMKVKEESEKVGLKLNIQKTKIMASGPITSWQIDRETVVDFIFLGSKITADGDCSHEIKRCLLLGRKLMTSLDSILKGRDITLPRKVCLVKAMVFPVVMYGCESWTIKKAEHRRIDALELWYWRRLLRVPWTPRRSNQWILKEISPEYSWKDWCWSWNCNPLATWCEELTLLKRPWCWERLKARG